MTSAEKLLLYALLLPPAIAAALLDRLGPRRRRPAPVSRILVLQPGNIGDLVLTVPFLRECRKIFPGASLSLVATSWNLTFARALPFVNEVLAFDNPFYVDPGHARGRPALLGGVRRILRFVREVRQKRFDIGFEFRGHPNALLPLYLSGAVRKIGYSYRGWGVFLDHRRRLDYLRTEEYEPDRLLRLLDFVSGDQRDARLMFVVGERERRAAGRLLREVGMGDSGVRVGLVIGAPWTARRWPLEEFVSLADWLISVKRAEVLVVGSGPERGLGDRLAEGVSGRAKNLAGRVPLDLLGAVLAECDLVVANDTGPMHVAAALGKPLIALFGPGEVSRWGPRGPNHVVIRSPVPCSPCDQRQMDAPCDHPERACMARIELGRVTEAIESLWDAAWAEQSGRLQESERET